jgi:hypothetical protein
MVPIAGLIIQKHKIRNLIVGPVLFFKNYVVGSSLD